jgi:hypothetical protein
MFGGMTAAPSGRAHFVKTSSLPANASLWQVLRAAVPSWSVPAEVRRWRTRNFPHFVTGWLALCVARSAQRVTGIPICYGVLSLRKIQGDGEVVDYGVVSVRKVTTAFVNYVATRLFDANTSIGNFDFHGFGTGVAAESNADTALGTEMTTQYATDNVRPTGTPTNPSANVYQSVATFSPDTGGTIAITEHGVFSQAATGGGTLMDRSVFSAVNLVAASDSLQSTYQLTLAAEA